MSIRDDIIASRIPAPAFIAMGMFWGVFGAYVPWIKAQAGLNDADFGLALLFGAAGAVGAMWIAPKVDRGLGAYAMVGGAVAMVAAFILPGLANSWAFFALAMLLAMGTSGLLDVIMNARLSGIEVEAGRSLMNLNHALYSFSYGVAAIGAGLMREAGIPPIVCFALIGLGTLIVTPGLRHEDKISNSDEAGTRHGFGLSKPLLICAGLVTLIGFMAEQATEGWSALHLERSLGVGAAEGAMGPAILGFTMGIGRLTGQVLTRFVSEGRALQGAGALAALGAVLAAWAPTPALVYMGFAVIGFGVSITAPMTLVWIAKTLPAGQRSLAISRVVLVGYTGFFIGPPLMGFLAQAFGLPMAFTILGALLALIAIVLVPALRFFARGGQPVQT
ncbi:MFS transporter [Epibacterium ulvae]|uniref:MFS transporter n=1 Tax=Epibacterium ulvae TaxID=1156985 RepID=UPI0024909D6F|nr:MFS transporter [Epibacterium ulvae]